MEIVPLLIGLAIILVAVIVWAFFWAVKSGQFDDLEGPAHRILMDDDAPPRKEGNDDEDHPNEGS